VLSPVPREKPETQTTMATPAEQTFKISSRQETAAPEPFDQLPIEDVETSIPDRFEKMVRLYRKCVTVKMGNRRFAYRDLKSAANRNDPRDGKTLSSLFNISSENAGRTISQFLSVVLHRFALSVLALAILQPTNISAQSPVILNAAGFDPEAYPTWPVLIAAEKGLLAREGIQIRSIRTDKAMMGLLAGSFEVINGGTFAALLAGEKGANLVLPYVLCNRPSEYLVLRKPLKMRWDSAPTSIWVSCAGEQRCLIAVRSTRSAPPP
jgi:hypothetical protein